MEIKIVENNKKEFLDLLLLADEEENMIDKYLDRGEMFVLYDKSLVSICVVTKENNGTYELKALATYPQCRKKGYGRYLIDFITDYYKEKGANSIIVGTGSGTTTVSFYEKCGFKESHILKNFFIDNYPNPIFENEIQLMDMIYLKKIL
ncbi:N-acetyltransferase [Dysgonomonas sp. BGC7]|uniref:GNAT family N-acetyltransferase n=1 Tax=Dysgonomonas sp. BGC7 TaxID=1658008 RepID=UPI0006804F0D|nr:GNAT family N-acetyltransferase [Dysgonomonas sp. BGC7]MBD8387652.1 GNAT family N-acetyltransferase [Dysgonomonas sp. BGC7]